MFPFSFGTGVAWQESDWSHCCTSYSWDQWDSEFNVMGALDSCLEMIGRHACTDAARTLRLHPYAEQQQQQQQGPRLSMRLRLQLN